MTVAKLMTAGELAETMISLIDAGRVVPVWNEECNELAFWPAEDVPAGADVVENEEVRAYFARIAERIFPRLN